MRAASGAIDGVPGEAGWDEAEPSTEQRAAPRFTLLIRTAKLIAPHGEVLCVVRDASQEGLKVRVFAPVPEAVPLTLELANGERHAVVRIWQDGDIAGFRFIDAVSIERLLADAPEGLSKRSVRLQLALPVTLSVAGREIAATFRDISQHGACLHCVEHLAMNARIALTGAPLPPLDAHVRWRRAPLYGVIFAQTFRFDELARLTAALEPASAGRGGAALTTC